MLVSNTATFPPYFPDDPNNGVDGSAKVRPSLILVIAHQRDVNFNGAVNASWYTVPSAYMLMTVNRLIIRNEESLPCFQTVSRYGHLYLTKQNGTVMNTFAADGGYNAPRIPNIRRRAVANYCGSRHGNWNPNKPYNSGVTNLLFLDGHVEPANRADLPQGES